MVHEIITNSTKQMLIYGRNFILNSPLQLPCCVWGRLIYRHSFKHRHRKKSETVRSGERAGHGIPNTGKCPSSLVNTLHAPPTRCHSNGMTSSLFRCADSALPRPKKVRRKCALHHPVV